MRDALIALVVLVGCATSTEVPAAHPASPRAPVGRLAGVAPSLRAGVVAYPDVPPLRTQAQPAHHHHHP